HMGGLFGQGVAVAILGIVLGQGVGLNRAFGSTDILDQASAVVGIQWIFLAGLAYSLFSLAITLVLFAQGGGRKQPSTESSPMAH
ncbi:MAG: hypothetical protein ACE5KG_05920, partial [Nitrososphaerales archaeon]